MTADEILRSFDFYRLATPERRAEYAAAASTVSLPEGVTFYREGDLCPHIALVGRGDIRVFREVPGDAQRLARGQVTVVDRAMLANVAASASASVSD